MEPLPRTEWTNHALTKTQSVPLRAFSRSKRLCQLPTVGELRDLSAWDADLCGQSGPIYQSGLHFGQNGVGCFSGQQIVLRGRSEL